MYYTVIMLYTPVAHGDIQSLRAMTEGVLSYDSDTINERLASLDAAVAGSDTTASFGMELEFAFIPILNSARPPQALDKDALYLKLIRDLRGSSGLPMPVAKGAMVDIDDRWGPVLLNEYRDNTYNPDQPDSDIIEIRTAPGTALEANENYWKVIAAVGKLAAELNVLGILINTHVNVGFTFHFGRSSRPADFRDTTPELTATTQHYLEQLRPLQIAAGLTPRSVLQAWPYKDGSTAIHQNRLEIRHSTVGIVDPRIDMFATLLGYIQHETKALPPDTQNKLGNAALLHFFVDPREETPEKHQQLCETLNLYVIFDHARQQLIMPAITDDGPSIWPADKKRVDNSVAFVAGSSEEDGHANNMAILRKFVRNLRLEKDKITLHNPSHYPRGVRDFVDKLYVTEIGDSCFTRPTIIRESAPGYGRRRQQLIDSRLGELAFGRARSRLSSPSDAISSRQRLLHHDSLTFV